LASMLINRALPEPASAYFFAILHTI
jgi:hypothetical protein